MLATAPQLAYLWRAGSAPVLLFVHGLGASGRCFAGAQTAAALSGRALLIPDLVGFGATPPEEGFSYALSAQAARIEALCAARGVAQLAIVAHSMGGPVGILLAEALGDRVSHFVNAVGNLVPEDCFFSRSIAEQGLAAFRSRGFRRFRHGIRAVPTPAGRSPSTYADTLDETTAEAMVASSADLVRACEEDDLLSRFVALPCPKLYLCDEDTPVAPSVLAALRAAAVPLHCIPNSGHPLMEHNPAAFYGAVAGFVRGGAL